MLRLLRELPGFEEHYPTRYENHGFHLVPTEELPDDWDHVVQGDGDDAGLSSASAGWRSSRACGCSIGRNPVIHRLLDDPVLD